MTNYALLKDNVVTAVLELTDEEVVEHSRNCMIIDLTDYSLSPAVGWLLEGNRVVPPPAIITGSQADSFQQNQQRLFGEKLANKATDWFGARNLKLGREGTPVDVAALSGALLNAKLLLQGGALKTARTVCGMVKGSFPNHTDIFDLIIADITAFLVANGWN